MIKVINETKPTTVNEVKEHSTPLTEDFFNLIICTTSITRRLTEMSKLDEKETEQIERQKQTMINAIAMISDILNLDEELDYKVEKKLKEELKPAEYVEYDVIPLLRFQEIQANLNTVIDGYFEVGENLTYEKTSQITTDLTRIENAIDDIATTISNEMKNNLVYKENKK